MGVKLSEYSYPRFSADSIAKSSRQNLRHTALEPLTAPAIRDRKAEAFPNILHVFLRLHAVIFPQLSGQEILSAY